MNITSIYNFRLYNIHKYQAAASFGSAADINLKYIQENHYNNIPQRMQKAIDERIKNKKDDISLRDLHLQEYEKLLDCKTLDAARNSYPEFSEVLPYEGTFPRGSKNTRKIAEKIPLETLPLYLLQERWGKLKSMDEITAEFGINRRSSLGWIVEKLRIPYFPHNYQCILNSSDEERNNEIARKTRDFNNKHREYIIEKNRNLSQDPRNKQLNKELADSMWALLPHVREEKRNFRAEHPEYSYTEYNNAFWGAHPEYKEEMSRVRTELAEERRKARKN